MKKYISGYVVKKVQNVKLGRFQSSFHRRKLKLNLDTSFTPTLTMEPVDSSEKEKKRNILKNRNKILLWIYKKFIVVAADRKNDALSNLFFVMLQ